MTKGMIPETGKIPAPNSTCAICGCRLKIEGKSIAQLKPPLYCPTHGKEQNAKPHQILPRAGVRLCARRRRQGRGR